MEGAEQPLEVIESGKVLMRERQLSLRNSQRKK
jgi:hypothetical protein